MSEQFSNPITSALRDHAVAFPETSEGPSLDEASLLARTDSRF